MSEHLICHCHTCGAVWDLDFMPETCECRDPDTSPEGCTFHVVNADDFRLAVAKVSAEVDQ